jgi:hypothetical protein|nr:MAG TPA: hypothetical protein [Caudoviricetes sp.]
MATYTKNLNLLKPAENEKYDVNLRNENWDKIDKAIGDGSDAIKKHKEANPIDHPDGSVTTPKIKDLNVTTPKLADKAVTFAKLADDVNQKLNTSYILKAGDTMTGDLNFETSTSIKIKRKAGAGFHTISDSVATDGQTNLDVGNPQFTPETNLCCYNRPGWYGKNKTTDFNPLVVFSDLGQYTQNNWRVRPELTPLIDWEQMKIDNGGNDVRNITVNHTGGKEKAYGGDMGLLTQKYKSPGNGTIVMKQSYRNFDAILIRRCNDDGFQQPPRIIPTWLLDYQFVSGSNVSLFHEDIGWNLLPFNRPPEYGANINPSTELIWQTWWQNCGIIEIYGVTYKPYSDNNQ